MIKDKLKNSKTYYNLGLKKGFEWLKSQDLENIECKKYIIDDDLYANVQEYNTKDDAKYEAHKNYIDIQYMIKGQESIGVTDRDNCSVCVDYDKEKDIEFLDCNVEEEYVCLEEGQFVVLYPQDAHKPSINYKGKHFVKKVVVKVKIN